MACVDGDDHRHDCVNPRQCVRTRPPRRCVQGQGRSRRPVLRQRLGRRPVPARLDRRPDRAHACTRPTSAGLEPLRRRPASGEPACGSSASVDRRFVPAGAQAGEQAARDEVGTTACGCGPRAACCHRPRPPDDGRVRSGSSDLCALMLDSASSEPHDGPTTGRGRGPVTSRSTDAPGQHLSGAPSASSSSAGAARLAR